MWAVEAGLCIWFKMRRLKHMSDAIGPLEKILLVFRYSSDDLHLTGSLVKAIVRSGLFYARKNELPHPSRQCVLGWPSRHGSDSDPTTSVVLVFPLSKIRASPSPSWSAHSANAVQPRAGDVFSKALGGQLTLLSLTDQLRSLGSRPWNEMNLTPCDWSVGWLVQTPKPPRRGSRECQSSSSRRSVFYKEIHPYGR